MKAQKSEGGTALCTAIRFFPQRRHISGRLRTRTLCCKSSESDTPERRIPNGALDWRPFAADADEDQAGGEIGLESHPELDQFLWIERGRGLVKMGAQKDSFSYQRQVSPGWCILIPAGTWHNLINTGCSPIHLFSLYAPPQHPRGTVQQTPADAAAE